MHRLAPAGRVSPCLRTTGLRRPERGFKIQEKPHHGERKSIWYLAPLD